MYIFLWEKKLLFKAEYTYMSLNISGGDLYTLNFAGTIGELWG